MHSIAELIAPGAPPRSLSEAAGRRLALALGAIATAIGAAYLGLWRLGVPPRWSSAGIITMKANTALGITLAGCALLLLGRGRGERRLRALAAGAAALVTIIGAATLVERLGTVDLGIDQLIAYEPPGMGNSAFPNRMGVPPACALLLLGCGLLALARRAGIRRWVAAAACLVVLVPGVGFAYGVGPLHADVARGMCMSWPTLVALFALGVGLWIVEPGDVSTSVLYRQDQGGRFLRRTLIPGISIPLLLGYIGLLGDRRGLYGRSVGVALLVVATTTALVVLLWRSARWLSDAEGERARAHAALRAANAQLREEDRRKDEFLSVLSHELRNPLAPVRNALFILSRVDPAPGPEARRAREVIDRQVAHLARLVDELLDVTRIARGRIELRLEPLDLAAWRAGRPTITVPCCRAAGWRSRSTWRRSASP